MWASNKNNKEMFTPAVVEVDAFVEYFLRMLQRRPLPLVTLLAKEDAVVCWDGLTLHWQGDSDMSCFDLFGVPTSIPGTRWFRMPLVAGACWNHRLHDETGKFGLQYHGTRVEAIDATLWHGKLVPPNEKLGGGIKAEKSGVYMFDASTAF